MKRICVIACGVLSLDIQRLAAELDLEISLRFLQGGLHEKPAELRRQLQIAIDEVSGSNRYERIAIGYGLCGRGTVGIESRQVPLAIPKVHDCIALFLGGDLAYRREFSRFPGTYYISAGWYEEKTEPLSQRRRRASMGDKKIDYDELVEKYGEANARSIFDFLNSWQRNYQRAAFIDTGVENNRKYADYAHAMANEFGWKYEAIKGDISLLTKLLTVEQTTDEILIVPPRYKTLYDAVVGGLTAKPLYEPENLHPRKTAATTHGSAGVSPNAHTVRLGLGIDAGGTYTDAVIFDFSSGRVLDKHKALTTKWDFTQGIGEALSGLDQARLQAAELVAVSTTLATNAIVEGEGQKVGLLLMPPYGLFNPQDVAHEPKSVISGRLEITGQEIQPVDEAQVRRVATDMVARFDVKAFAVSGFAGAINPAHELQVKKNLIDETGLIVTCGHELSDLLNFRTRAQTAVLNARIIPRLAKLIRDLEKILQSRTIAAPIVVVKGDGTLMRKEMALERPVETILSGPAASVAGARYLTGRQNAIVVDMGGTTTDTAVLQQGAVRVCEKGSDVGGFKTHVKALEIRTTGLGGDSYIIWNQGDYQIGPQRVAPLAWLGKKEPHADQALNRIRKELDIYRGSTKPLQILMQTAPADGLPLNAQEKDILKLLRERPCSLQELADRTHAIHRGFLPLARLEENHIIQRCGLTPTDLLNASGGFSLWDQTSSRMMCDIFSEITGMKTRELVEHLLNEVVKRLALEVIKKQLEEDTDPEALENCNVCRVLLNNLLARGGRNYSVHIDIHQPIIGIGAPAHYFLTRAVSLLGAEAILPEHADVANAIGAVTSHIRVRRQVQVKPGTQGGFMIEGFAGAKWFAELEPAAAYAEIELVRMVRNIAHESGTSETTVDVDVQDHVPQTAEGQQVFLGRTITAQLVGRPDLPIELANPKKHNQP